MFNYFCFYLQLPCRIGPQTTHSSINEEQNKNCIIQISKYRFALVLDGFVKVLKRIHELVSILSVVCSYWLNQTTIQ